ncbi:hypothetical protein LCGC14_2539070, partial [marine sediment metagenome]
GYLCEVWYRQGDAVSPVGVIYPGLNEFISLPGRTYYVAVSDGDLGDQYTVSVSQTPIEVRTIFPTGRVFFDDFDYPSVQAEGFQDTWVDASSAKWGGTHHSARFDSDYGVMLLDASRDAAGAGGKISRVETAFQVGPTGTYAARVWFANAEPGSDWQDPNDQGFYAAHPAYDLNPAYSEVAFEYLTDRGWEGEAFGDFLQLNSWNARQSYDAGSFVPDDDPYQDPLPLYSAPQAGELGLPAETLSNLNTLDGKWTQLIFQVYPTDADDPDSPLSVRYFVDGIPVGQENGSPDYPEYGPDHAMNIVLSNWFAGASGVDGSRTYTMAVDWVYYSPIGIMGPEDVSAAVDGLRSVGFSDDMESGLGTWTVEGDVGIVPDGSGYNNVGQLTEGSDAAVSADVAFPERATELSFDYQFTTNQEWKLTYQESADEGAARAIPFNVITEVLE